VAGASAAQTRTLPIRAKKKPQVYALIDYDDDYVQPLIMAAMKSLLPADSFTLVKPPSSWSKSSPEIALPDLIAEPNAKVLQIMPYESIDFDFASSHPDTCLVNSYVIRKALIRKHFLSATVDNWVAKHPNSVLKTHVKRSEAFEVDFAEFLDDALIEAFDLRESLDKNAAAAYGADGNDDNTESVAEQDDDSNLAAAKIAEGKGKNEDTTEWWILKPSMSDRGQGIRLFNTMEQLQEIFDEWEPESSDEEDGDEDENESENKQDDDEQGGGDDDRDDTGIMTSHLRHFVAQPYIHPPLLLPQLNNRKFHIRVYVLCVGSLRVYVYRDMLALFAAKPYQAPGSGSGPNSNSSSTPPDLDAHLTNTCLQTTTPEGTTIDLVHRLADLPLPAEQLTSLTTQICAVTGDLFEAAARGMTIHFQPLPQAFEVYGLDFLADAEGTAWLLEVNAFPDFKQTGAGPAGGVVSGFWEGVVKRAVLPFVVNNNPVTGSASAAVGGVEGEDDGDGMVLVREVDLGRRW
jgi:hypothetical protein